MFGKSKAKRIRDARQGLLPEGIEEDLISVRMEKDAGGPLDDCSNCDSGLIEVLGKQGLETRTCKKCRGTGKVKNIRGILGL